jgi:hypothetical protein
MTTARDLLDLIADYVTTGAEGSDTAADRLQEIAQRFNVALGEAIIDRAGIQNEA